MFSSLPRLGAHQSAQVLTAFLSTVVLATPAAYAQGHAHQHGVAKLDIAIEAQRITLHLDSPLDNLTGFERAPRNDAERKRAADAVAQLRASRMFMIDPAAQCQPAQVELVSEALGLGVQGKHEHDDEEAGHADLDGDFSFDCVNATKAGWIDVGLFDFARMQKLEVQLATPAGQFRRDMARPAKRIVLTK